MKNGNKINIPWYRKNVVRPQQLESDPFGGFDFPELDPDRRRRRRRNTPDPTPDPTPQPDGVRVPVAQKTTYPVVVTIEGKQYIDDGVFLTPLDVKQPNKIPNPTPSRKPQGGRIPELEPNFPRLPDLSPKKPALGMGVPGDEILLKLMEGDPSYSKFVKKYNEYSMQFLWEVQNPFIIFEYPTYGQVKKLLKTFDIEKMNSKDVKAYFKDLGIKGKDLNTAATRFFIFYETLKVGGQLEDIFVPPIKNSSPIKKS